MMFEMRVLALGEPARLVESVEIDGVVMALPLSKPIVGRSVRVREDELLPRLETASDAAAIRSALCSAGADLCDAHVFAAALGSATTTAEIVVVDEEQRLGPGAVAVFCSRRGDAVSIPSVAADGGRWFTLAPATPRRIALACADLAQRRRAVR